MDASVVHFLTASSTYQELALRSQEFLHYQHPSQPPDLRQLAEDTFFNIVVEYIISAGMPRLEAEAFCYDINNLQELAMRIHSTLGRLA